MVLQIVLGAIVAALSFRPRSRLKSSESYTNDRPTIELTQEYGGWNADAYDAGTGHDRSWSCRLPVTPWDGYRR